MTPNEDARPVARKTALVIREIADELLVYDLKTHKAHCLNQTAALVWRNCDGIRSVAQIASLIGGDLNTSVDEAAVWLALEQLGKARLLEERLIPSSRLSRRETVRRLGAALAVPVVMSIIAPAALSSSSCTPNAMDACNTPTAKNTYGYANNMCCSLCCNGGGDCVAVDSMNRANTDTCTKNSDCCSNMCSGNPGTCF